MVKKYILAGAMLACLLMPQKAYAPTLENKLNHSFELDINEYAQKMIISREERELLRNDKIYRIIDSVYRQINVPNYITKKFVRSLIKVESDDNPTLVSKRGARGLGQIMRSTWYDIEKDDYFKNVFIPERNICAEIKYLKWLDGFCKARHPRWDNLKDIEKIDLISAAYNGGGGRLHRKNWEIKKMPAETRGYVPKIHKTSKKFIPSAEIYEPISARIY